MAMRVFICANDFYAICGYFGMDILDSARRAVCAESVSVWYVIDYAACVLSPNADAYVVRLICVWFVCTWERAEGSLRIMLLSRLQLALAAVMPGLGSGRNKS
jgi:hypothetical protein